MFLNKLLPLIISTIAIVSFLGYNNSLGQFAFASQSYCPPICLDEVNQHVDNAREYLDKGNIVKAISELDIVNRLLDQLKDMTSGSN